MMLQGNFQYLGAIRFPAGFNAHQSVVAMQVLVPNKVPDSLRILLFSDQPASFAMVLADCIFVVMRLASSIVCCECVRMLYLQIGRALANKTDDDSESGNTCQQKSAVRCEKWVSRDVM